MKKLFFFFSTKINTIYVHTNFTNHSEHQFCLLIAQKIIYLRFIKKNIYKYVSLFVRIIIK